MNGSRGGKGLGEGEGNEGISTHIVAFCMMDSSFRMVERMRKAAKCDLHLYIEAKESRRGGEEYLMNEPRSSFAATSKTW